MAEKKTPATRARRKRPYGTEATREHLVKNARELFHQKGFKDASIGQLVSQAGGSKETIYRHFSSKEELLSAVFDAELKDYVATLAPLREPPPEDVKKGLTDLAQGLLIELTSDHSVSLHQNMTAETRSRPEVGQLFYALYISKGYEIGEQYLGHYQQTGQLRKMNARHLAEYFSGMLMYRTTLMRQCGVISAMSRAEARKLAVRVVEDFLEVFGA